MLYNNIYKMDAFLEYYKDNNGTTSKHTLTAMKGNLKRIGKLLDTDPDDLQLKDFKNVDSIVENIIDSFSISTSISTILAIISFLKYKKASDDLIEDYKDLLNELIKERNEDNNDQELKGNELENWIEYPELKKKVEKESEDFLNKLVDECKSFGDNDVVIVACDDMYITSDELNNYVHALNKVFVRDDVYLIPSYPDDEVIEFLESDDFEPDNNFYMVLIQSYQKLEDGSSSLSKTNYYEHWSDEYYADTVLVRKQYGDIHGKRNEKKS